ncbi:MAG: hypothetical protein NUV57_01255 [archaeon]|nr:hypothetical protein [archaeon]
MSEKKDEKVSMDKNTLIALFLGAMFLLAAFQTVQLSELKQNIYTQKNEISQLKGTANLAAAPVKTQTASNDSSGIPQSLQNVPDMVGGC